MWENLDFRIQVFLHWTCLMISRFYSYATVWLKLKESGRVGTSECSSQVLRTFFYLWIHYEITVRNKTYFSHIVWLFIEALEAPFKLNPYILNMACKVSQ